MKNKLSVVGKSLRRVEALEKACGETLFIDDMPLPECWLGGTVRADVPRGKIRAIRRDPDFDWESVVFADAGDIPGTNAVSMIRDDYPALAPGETSFSTQAVALIAAPDRQTLLKALSSVSLDIEELPPVLDVEEAARGNTVIWGDNNVMDEYRVACGDTEAAFSSADFIIEGTYRTKHQEHAYLETQGIVAIPGKDDSMEIIGSMQCPYYVHTALVKGFSCDPGKIVVKQAATGGAFGGKEDYPSILAFHAALLARKSGRAVKMVYDRKEDLLCTTKRHPSIIRIKTGVMKDGSITAADIDILLDGGAFTTMSKVVLSRGILHATGCYFIPAADIRARAVATNTPPNGAFRGFGVPQSAFAMERHMDRIARETGIEPLSLREKNLMKNGSSFPFGQVLKEGVSAGLVLEKVLQISGYREKRRQFEEENKSSPSVRKGIGLSLSLHGGGFTGSGEESISGVASVRVTEDRKVEVLVSSVEMGQGASTVLAMIAAETLGLDLSDVRHHMPDTSAVPNSGPTVASRTTMYVGKLVQEACLKLAKKMGEKAGDLEALPSGSFEYAGGKFTNRADGREIRFFDLADALVSQPECLEASVQYSPIPGFSWSEDTYTGDAYKAYAWIASVVEVAVDMDTYEIQPLKAYISAEAGKVISPVLASGQIEGGSLQAFGYAYLENISMKNGAYATAHLNQYLIPTSLDSPDFLVDLQEVPFPGGPYGAKGLGELPMDSGAPAIAAAVEHAVGVFPDRIPITGEYLHFLLSGISSQKEQGTT